jgi:hypothetical protein
MASNDASEEMTAAVQAAFDGCEMLDLVRLCSESARAAWVLRCDVRCLNDAGSSIDAAVLAVAAALEDTRLPVLMYSDEHRVAVNRSEELRVIGIFGVFLFLIKMLFCGLFALTILVFFLFFFFTFFFLPLHRGLQPRVDGAASADRADPRAADLCMDGRYYALRSDPRRGRACREPAHGRVRGWHAAARLPPQNGRRRRLGREC